MFDSPKDVARRLLSTGAQGVGIGHLLRDEQRIICSLPVYPVMMV